MGLNPSHCVECDRPFLPKLPVKTFEKDDCRYCSEFWTKWNLQDSMELATFRVVDYGPLHWDKDQDTGFDPTDTFIGPTYKMVTPKTMLVLGRGITASTQTKDEGRFFHAVPQGHAGAVRHEMAVPHWNQLSDRSLLFVPPEVKVFKGQARAFDGKAGGGVQYFIPRRTLVPLMDWNAKLQAKLSEMKSTSKMPTLYDAFVKESRTCVLPQQTQWWKEYNTRLRQVQKKQKFDTNMKTTVEQCRKFIDQRLTSLSLSPLPMTAAKAARMWIQTNELMEKCKKLCDSSQCSADEKSLLSGFRPKLELIQKNYEHLLRQIVKYKHLTPRDCAEHILMQSDATFLVNEANLLDSCPESVKEALKQFAASDKQLASQTSLSSDLAGRSFVVHKTAKLTVTVTFRFLYTEVKGKITIHWYEMLITVHVLS